MPAISVLSRAAKFWGDANRPAWAETDAIPGHEFFGKVVQLDDLAADRWGIEVGDRVVAEQIVPLLEMPLLREWRVLDVRPARHVWLQAPCARRHGGVKGAYNEDAFVVQDLF